MNKQKFKAFTLVELIVVITILAILGTIAFISLQGYSTDARDSTRISDMSTIKSALELYNLDAGKYPIPTNGVDITYSGSTVWTQGTIGETVYANLSKLDKIPKDPITDKEYTYSTTANKYEYQLGGITEGDSLSFQNHEVSAGLTDAKAYIAGSYNGLMTKSNSGSTCNILAIPSIITNNTSSGTDLQTITNNNGFVYRGYKNLPSSFKGSKFNHNGGFAFTPNKLLAYSDTGSCASLTSPDSSTARVNLIKGLQDSYSGTILENEGEIANIVNLDINISSPSTEVVNYAGLFVNNVLGSKLSAGSNSSSNTSTGSTSTGTMSETINGWGNYDTIVINSSYPTTLTGYVMGITINTSSLISSGSMNSDCSDLRITNTGSLLLDHWIEYGCNTLFTKVWFKTDSIINGVNNYKLQYGNIGASSNQVSPSTLFTFYDNFDDNSLNTSYWQSSNAAGGSNSETNGKLRLYCAGDTDGATDIGRVNTLNNLTGSFKINYLWERDQTTSTSYGNYRYFYAKYSTQGANQWTVDPAPRKIYSLSTMYSTSLPDYQNGIFTFAKSGNNYYSEFSSGSLVYTGSLNTSIADGKFYISSECGDHGSTYANYVDNYKVMNYVYPEPVFVGIN